jgi:hypothetical protein
MTTSLRETLGARRRLAAERAADAAALLDNGGQRSASAQLEVEQALRDLRFYAEAFDALEPMVDDLGNYRRDGGFSLLGDLWASRQGNRAASRRIESHAREVRSGALHEQEARAIGGSSVWAQVPRWLLDDSAPLSTAVAPLVKLLAKPLPTGAQGTVNLVSWTTPPVATAQNGLNGALNEPSIVDFTEGPGVKTFAVRAKLSFQLLEQGRQAIDSQLIPAMIASLDAKINDSVLNGGGTSGEVLGIRNTSSITTGTYTDATPTVVECWPVIEGAIRGVEVGMGGSPLLVMHPRRLSWLRQRAIVENLAALDFDEPTLPGATCSVLGSVQVVTDPNIPVTLGTGTNEDCVIALRSTASVDMFLGEPRLQIGDVDEQSVYVQCWRQVAFTSRLPVALAVVGGTGLVAPAP